MSEFKKLKRSNNNRMIAGVCGGLGEFLDIDPTIVRLLFAFGFIAGFGTALLVYLVLAIVIPPEEETIDEA
ncbi:PspC domain-containing protein [Chloroflexota bacterium]